MDSYVEEVGVEVINQIYLVIFINMVDLELTIKKMAEMYALNGGPIPT